MKPALILIPTRLASTRLPRKPLVDIGGKPMIVRVMEQALKTKIGPVVVASGDREISEIVRENGGRAIDTDPNLLSGSDRIYQALSLLQEYDHIDTIINVQGDLPLIDPSDIGKSLIPLKYSGIDIGTLIAPVKNEFEKTAFSVVKVACSFSEDLLFAKALYFSRATIPWGKGPLWHHVGIYAYTRKSLNCFINLPQSLLEKREKLEQLRALEAGMNIGCAVIDEAPLGIDTPDDLERIRKRII